MSVARGKQKLALVRRDMPGLNSISSQPARFEEFRGARIAGCVTVTPETGLLILTLAELGVDLRWCSDNQLASDDDVVDFLRSEGLAVFARANMSRSEYLDALERTRRFPDDGGDASIIDDGADLTSYIAERDPGYMRRVRGITEQTTCGIAALTKLYARGATAVPSIDINGCFTKRHFDNYHGVQESLVRGLMTATGMQLAGKSASIFGYGPVGQGAATILRSLGCEVSVVEKDLLKAAHAHYAGFPVRSAHEAVSRSQLCITATGCEDTISAALIEQAADGLMLCNIGHGCREYDVAYLHEAAQRHVVSPFLELYTFPAARGSTRCVRER